MVLINGGGFSISDDTATHTSSGVHAWCYDSDIITISVPVKYYFNDDLQYTSEDFSTGDYYPYLSARGNIGESWTLERGSDSDGSYIQWTINFNAGTGGKYAGFNHDTVSTEDAISAGMHVQAPGKWHSIREDDVAVFTVTSPPYVLSGDKFKIVYAAAAGAATQIYPSIPQQKLIYNQAFLV